MVRRVFLLFLLLIPTLVGAQSVLTGNIFDNTNRSILLEGSTVKNLTSKALTLTDKDGHFILPAKAGDLVSFGLVGYHIDTIYLTNVFPRNVYLRAMITNLNTVNVTGVKLSPFLDVKDPYAMPSRSVEYSKEKGGLRLNLGYNKFRREQQKVQELEEYDQFNEEISKNFSVEFVKKLLKIDGSDLKDFMEMYRPTVNLIKSERPFNYELYTAQSYSTWMKLPADQKKLPSLLKPKN